MAKPQLRPTADQTFRIEYVAGEGINFRSAVEHSRLQENEGDIEGACNTRFRAFQALVELIPDDEEIVLEWNDPEAQAALLVVERSAIDHFLAGDWEMCAAMSEMLLELDPEDHFEATVRLAYTYVAMEEYESFDEVINDVNDKYPDKEVLVLWSEFRRSGRLPEGDLFRFRSKFAPYYREFVADRHPVDEAYVAAIENPSPAPAVLARELWLKTEHLWTLFPGFIEALRRV